MSDRKRFYEIRDRRSVEYGVPSVFDQPIQVFVGSDAASNVSGQYVVLSLVNMLARLHHRIALQIPPAPLLVNCMNLRADTLGATSILLAKSVDPFIDLSIPNEPCGVAIGVGAKAPHGLPWYICWDHQIAFLDREPYQYPMNHSRVSLGAALAACLGAGNILKQVLSLPNRPVRLSAWNLREGRDAKKGPQLVDSVNVGDALIVGGGGVGSCLAYWTHLFGYRGNWCYVDGDIAELNDANRCLGILPIDCGWPATSARMKSEIAAELTDAQSKCAWYDADDLGEFTPDLILALANERGVRSQIASLGEPVVLHATISQTWEAQLHRHVPDRDDCILCRMPPKHEGMQFPCSTVQIGESTSSGSSDAALPFLSATAALMLLSSLYRLEAGELLDEDHNLWAVCFNDLRRTSRRSICTCKAGCAVGVPRTVRQLVNAGRRWSFLDAREA